MLISMSDVVSILYSQGLVIKGILHVGAHRCEEKEEYERYGVRDVIWIEANSQLVAEARQLHPNINIIHAAVSDKEEQLQLNIANNGQSSSLLDLATHQYHYPDIKYVGSESVRTQTLQSIFEQEKLDTRRYNFWNLDIQGVELQALKGAGNLLNAVDAIYTEVNVNELYKGCSRLPELDLYLKEYGFVRLNTTIVPAGWGDALYVKI